MGLTLRVLLVDDDAESAGQIVRALMGRTAPRFEVERAQAISSARWQLTTDTYDIALLNLARCEPRGLAAVALLQALTPDLPILVHAPAAQENLALKAVQQGAADYLITEQIYPTVLVRSIRHAIERQLAAVRHRSAEQALRESEARYRALFEQSRDAIVLMDRDRNITAANRALSDLLGYSASQIIGRNLHLLYCDSADAHELEAELAAKASSREAETRLRRVDGTTVWCLLSTATRMDDQGEICGYQAIIHDITDRKRAEERLIHNALHDALTGLPNRALFADRLNMAMARMRRHPSHRFAVLFLDLDRFKVVNDSLGHAAGDRLLVEIASVLVTCTRREDTVARLGGDEFAILLDGITGEQDAINTVDRIQQRLMQPFDIAGHHLFTSASIGVAFPAVEEQTTSEELLRNADIAMYGAKAAGPAHMRIYDRAMHERAAVLLELETDLRHAVTRKEFELVYQPIIALRDDRIAGIEALIRWRHPRRGLLQPHDFVPVAEETGLIVEIGWWALSEACRQAAAWLELCPPDRCPVMSVNLSSRQIMAPDLVERVESTLDETGLPGRLLSLEITESTLMSDSAVTAASLVRLRAMGIQLCIDDFGTGYSSLAYLHALPIDVLKIDRSFIGAIGSSEERSELVGTIISLARRLGITAVAEGVETQDQITRLQQMGSEYVQGFYYSKPISSHDTAALLKQRSVTPPATAIVRVARSAAQVDRQGRRSSVRTQRP
jgi:diguanylate cyclase (GGDEF)-like protein/PAS domain S-box-containing protein